MKEIAGVFQIDRDRNRQRNRNAKEVAEMDRDIDGDVGTVPMRATVFKRDGDRDVTAVLERDSRKCQVSHGLTWVYLPGTSRDTPWRQTENGVCHR